MLRTSTAAELQKRERSAPRSFSQLTFGLFIAGSAVACGADGSPPSPHSAFASDVLPGSAVPVNGPSGPHLVRWDFSTEKTYSYAYTQRAKVGGAINGPMQASEMDGEGVFDVVSKAGGAATLVLHDLVLRMTSNSRQLPVPAGPPQVITGFHEDGSADGADARTWLMSVLLPLPRKALQVGESDEVPINVPYNANGSPLMIRGSAKVTLAEFVSVDTRLCAVLNVVMEASRLEVPPELPGSYRGSLTGTSVAYFDLAEGALVSANVALLLSTSSEVPGAQGPPSNIAMTMDTQITLTRRSP